MKDPDQPAHRPIVLSEVDERRARAIAESLVGRHCEIVKVEGVQGGAPVFSHSRLPVAVVIAAIWLDESDAELLQHFPRLRLDLIRWLRRRSRRE